MRGTKMRFDLYRYQLLPATQSNQQDILRPFKSVEELKEAKNHIFGDLLQSFPPLLHRTSEVRTKIDYQDSEWFILHIGVRKNQERFKEDFNKEWIDSWPNIVVIFNNRPDFQIMAVARNYKAFSSTSTVVNIVLNALHKPLLGHQLQIQAKPMFNKQDFWDLLDTHSGKVTSVKFELVTPNMANISGSLKIDLLSLNKSTNSHRTDIQINSADDSVLEIDRENELLESLVEYSSKGGADVHVKVKGLQRRLKTSTTVKEIEIDELSVKNPNPLALQLIRELLDG